MPSALVPLPVEVVVLEEMIVAEGGVRHDERLHRHGVLFEQVGDAGARIDDDLVGEARIAAAIHRLLAGEHLAEGPVMVELGHRHGRIGVQHLFRGDDLDLVGVDVELEIVQRDLLDCLVGAVENRKIPFGFAEQEPSHPSGLLLAAPGVAPQDDGRRAAPLLAYRSRPNGASQRICDPLALGEMNSNLCFVPAKPIAVWSARFPISQTFRRVLPMMR